MARAGPAGKGQLIANTSGGTKANLRDPRRVSPSATTMRCRSMQVRKTSSISLRHPHFRENLDLA
jgi:hypothetical protein